MNETVYVEAMKETPEQGLKELQMLICKC